MPGPAWSAYCDRISGVWSCVAFEVFDSDSSTKKLLTRPHGDKPLSRIVITRNGWISVHTANPQRSLQPRESGKPWLAAEDAEVAYVSKGLTMWCGHLQLFEDDSGLYWESKVEVAADPTKIGEKEARRVDFIEGDGKEEMVFSTMQGFLLPDGTRAHAVLTWTKLEPV